VFFIPSLNDLTIPNLQNLAKECKIELKKGKKADIIKQIKDARIDNKRLEDLINKFTVSKKVSKKKESKIEERLNLLENQVKFLMLKVGSIEAKLGQEKKSTLEKTTSMLSNIKETIVSIIPPGNSMTIDELITHKNLKNISKNVLEQAVNDLIDEEIFDTSEGYSNQKLEGNIGRIIRR